jgi:hypothetical protein
MAYIENETPPDLTALRPTVLLDEGLINELRDARRKLGTILLLIQQENTLSHVSLHAHKLKGSIGLDLNDKESDALLEFFKAMLAKEYEEILARMQAQLVEKIEPLAPTLARELRVNDVKNCKI